MELRCSFSRNLRPGDAVFLVRLRARLGLERGSGFLGMSRLAPIYKGAIVGRLTMGRADYGPGFS